jgi:hypothetical protein
LQAGGSKLNYVTQQIVLHVTASPFSVQFSIAQRQLVSITLHEHPWQEKLQGESKTLQLSELEL